jgi:hypothetical protein
MSVARAAESIPASVPGKASSCSAIPRFGFIATLLAIHLTALAQPQDPAAVPPKTQAEVKQSPSKLPFYEIRMEPKHLQTLERNPWSDQTIPRFSADGESYGACKSVFEGMGAPWPKPAASRSFSIATNLSMGITA